MISSLDLAGTLQQREVDIFIAGAEGTLTRETGFKLTLSRSHISFDLEIHIKHFAISKRTYGSEGFFAFFMIHPVVYLRINQTYCVNYATYIQLGA